MNKRSNRIKIAITFACMSFMELSSANVSADQPTNTQGLAQNCRDSEKCLFENSLRHSILISGYPSRKMNILDRMNLYNVPGVSIAIINKGEIAWSRGYGTITNDVNSKQVDAHTLFQAGSISKSLTAFGALLLVQQGKIDLDEDVNTYLRSWKIPENEFTQIEKVTLRRLLSHTAGTSVQGFPGYIVGAPVPSTIDVLDGNKPLVNTDPVRVVHQPGSKFQYSGGGITIIQLLIEDITGENFDIWMQKNVLDPLGMSDSTFKQPFSHTHADHAAHGHQKNEKVNGYWHVYPEKAAAGLWSTPTDLAKFVLHIQLALKTETTLLLNPNLLQEMVVRQLPSGKAVEPGLGFFIEHEGENLVFQHEGQDEGFIASLYGFATRDQGFVIMMNNDSGWALMGEITNSIADTYKWPNFVPLKKESASLNSAVLGDLKGQFIHEDDEIEVSIIANKPYIHFKNGFASIIYGFGHPTELFPENDHVYFIQEADVKIEFIASPSNKIETLILTHPDKETTSFQRK